MEDVDANASHGITQALCKKMKYQFLIMAFVLGAAQFIAAKELRAVPESDVGTKIEIIGHLGIPVGKSVTITGRKQRNGPGDNTFRVTSIDGIKKEASIDVIGIEDWADGTEAKLIGAEVGNILYVTGPYANYGPDDPRCKVPRQLISLRFKVESVVSPPNLSLKK